MLACVSTAPGFCRCPTVAGTDGLGVLQNQSGWIVVGKPAATLAKTGDNQTGGVGSTLNLSVALSPGQSGGTSTGATIFFTASSGSLSSRMVTTDSSGNASVVLTLPVAAGPVDVLAEGPYGLGHPAAAFKGDSLIVPKPVIPSITTTALSRRTLASALLN